MLSKFSIVRNIFRTRNPMKYILFINDQWNLYFLNRPIQLFVCVFSTPHSQSESNEHITFNIAKNPKRDARDTFESKC